ncbi:hypothetical protein F442_21333 [Phytophthora nicotianae P10297]|uniref:Histone-lysine N-methyltransferase, H3 lysine-79 specific n=1 Tax=Phytophthora nicotianae P10297 TaxID=1317064 RepID=W2Y3F5_PHYNI|nr:hypothetical protein F442_21333 [Phytophthora nicotianae P10297]
MSSRRLLGAPPQPPLVLQRPVRPACRPPATPSSAKGPYGDHHAPGDDISASATSGKEVPDSKEKEIQGRCDQGGGGCIVRSCGHPLVAIPKSASGTDFGSCGDNVQAAEAVDIIFGSISAHDVRQPAGRTYDNAGEVVPSGVTLLLAAVGLIDEADVFLDVGAGVGNVLAQVALMTNVRACVGIELRRDLVSIGEHRMRLQHRKYPRLRKVQLKQADCRDVLMSQHPLICEATIVFANIFLFEEDAKLVVSRELSAMPVARMIVATSLFCPRHRSSCSEPYCKC